MRRLPFSTGVWVLLADQGLMNAGFFMLFPLLTVHLTRDLGFDATAVGLVFASRQLVQQGCAPIGGALSDRIGYKPVLLAGFFVRMAGFLIFAVSDTLPAVLAGAIVTALGGSLFDPPSRAALARLTPEHQRQSAYAAAGAASWMGQVIGPLIGALLLSVSFVWVSIVAAGAFLVAAIQVAIFLPGGLRGDAHNISLWSSIGAAARDREFARFTSLLLGYYFLATQSIITMPLLATRLIGPEAIGLIFAIQAGLAMVLQVPLSAWASRVAPPLTQMSVAMLVVAVGFTGYVFARDVWGLAAATVLVSIGQLVVAPVQSTTTARLAGGRGGAYFGVGSLALALGGALGAGSGGLLLDLGDQFQTPWLPWTTMAAIALVTAFGLHRLGRDPKLQRRLTPVRSKA